MSYSPAALCKIILSLYYSRCTNLLIVVPRRQSSVFPSLTVSTIFPNFSTLLSTLQFGLPVRLELALLPPPLPHSAPCSVKSSTIIQRTIVPVASARARGRLAIHHEQDTRSIQVSMVIMIFSSRIIVQSIMMSK